jgi:hypothetical protein
MFILVNMVYFQNLFLFQVWCMGLNSTLFFVQPLDFLTKKNASSSPFRRLLRTKTVKRLAVLISWYPQSSRQNGGPLLKAISLGIPSRRQFGHFAASFGSRRPRPSTNRPILRYLIVSCLQIPSRYTFNTLKL